MKQFVIIISVFLMMSFPLQKAHALDAKSKAFLVMCTYGTVGGALLGFATMAFGTNSRAIAQGASLGLYAGIAFGSYVVYSHGQKGKLPPEDEYYTEPGYGDSPEQLPPPDPMGGFGAPLPEEDGGASGGFFGQRHESIGSQGFRFSGSSLKKFKMPIYINFYNKRF